MANINGIEIKAYKEIEGHGDTPTFSAKIYINGKKIGWVGNNGWGGDNEYRFDTTELEKEFIKKVKGWKKDKNYATWDMFVEEIINRNQEEKIKAKNAKKGFPITLLIQKGRGTFDKEVFYNQEYYIGLRNANQIKDIVKKEQADNYKILE